MELKKQLCRNDNSSPLTAACRHKPSHPQESYGQNREVSNSETISAFVPPLLKERRLGGEGTYYQLFFIILLTFLLITGATYEEIINDKNRQAEYVEKQIQIHKESLNEINSRISAFKRQADSIEAEINDLNSFLKNYENESYMTPDQIAIETNMIIYLAEEVERIQESFKKKVVNLYKHGKNYELELLFSSKSPNEYLSRNKYLQHFSQNRKKELRELKSKKFILEEKKKMLTLSTSSQRYYVEARRNEKVILESKLKEIKIQTEAIAGEVNSETERIRRYESQLININNFMNNLAANKDKFKGSKINRLSYDSQDLSAVKGNLNTPLDAGLLITGFGNYMNNVTNTISFNSGIDYSVATGSKVYAVAGGVVSIVGELPFFGTCVIIKHENGYRTVYASLSETNVIAGEVVKLNQVIGKTGETLEGQMFHFELWKDASPLNSNEWFRR